MEKPSNLGAKQTKLLAMSQTLCSDCLERQGSNATDSRKLGVDPSSCSLCHGASERVGQIIDQALHALSDFEFDTFLVGASLPQVVLDAEDEIRARFKIRGREGIKTQTTRRIARKIAHVLSKQIEYSRPDITLLASLVDGSVSAIPRSVWVSGAYTKSERGLPQRSSICRICNGIGCAICNYKGTTAQSVESILSSYLKEVFIAESCNFIWIGSEDSRSIVGGNGRLFYAELVSPKKRNLTPNTGSPKRLEGKKRKKVELGPVSLLNLEILGSRPKSIPQFCVKCIVYLIESLSEGESRKIDSEAIERFHDTTVQVHLSRKYRITTRNIYSAMVKRDVSSHPFALELVCDGGIPIRKFVTGEGGTVVPNLSNSIKGFMIDPDQPFDILDVEIIPSRQEGFHVVSHRRNRTRRKKTSSEFNSQSEDISSQELVLEN
ncbi:MAG: hypothetical protein ACRECH_03745 [Nitrososphaerales archaeon]